MSIKSLLWATVEDLKATKNEIKDSIDHLRSRQERLREEVNLSQTIVDLKRQIVTLEIERDKIKEKQDTRERELTHMIGLEKKRQEFEITQAKRETTVQVREENLTADKTRFAEQVKFQNERFTAEVGYLKDVLGEILKRLPTVTVDRQIGGTKGKD